MPQLSMKNERIWSYVKETTSHLQNKLYWIFMKLYTFIVHYLQMCMKEYDCCPKFKRRDNSTYTFTKRGVVYLFLVSLFWRWDVVTHTHTHIYFCYFIIQNLSIVIRFIGNGNPPKKNPRKNKTKKINLQKDLRLASFAFHAPDQVDIYICVCVCVCVLLKVRLE
jgi:hypothetical protein